MFSHKCGTNVEITWPSAWFLVSFIAQLYCDVLHQGCAVDERNSDAY